MENVAMSSSFWQGKRVFLTGHTGFKGSWLSLWLQQLGAEVTGFSLVPSTQPNLFETANVENGMTSIIGDIRDLEHVKKVFKQVQPEIVIHMAAQALVRYSYDNPVETYATNVMGTLHVLEAIRSITTVRSAVMITTDKCYENKEWQWGYRENEAMGGHDPYSSSKGCAELLIASYRNSFFPAGKHNQHQTAIASARAGNVIGGGDWSEDRLVPDIIKAFVNQKTVNIRNPKAIRPWQHVLEPLSGYLVLAEKLYTEGNEFAEAWNFGPKSEDVKPVQWIVEKMALQWGDKVKWNVDTEEHPHEAHYLRLDCSKANENLHWHPQWDLPHALQKIIKWHKAILDGKDMQNMCIEQINEYSQGLDKAE